MRWLSKIWIATTLTIMGCQPYVVVPSLDGVSPNWGFNGDETPVEIFGNNLFPGIDIRGNEINGFDRDFSARISGPDGVDLSGVRLNADGGISASVPRGLAPGWYDLEVQTPSGNLAVLHEGFEVTDTRADHIRMTVDNNTRRVEEIAIVRLSIRDPSGRIVEDSTPIKIVASGGSETGTPWTFDTGDLLSPELIEDGTGIVGDVGPSGQSFFAFKAHRPGDYRITVEATIRDRVTLTSSVLVHVDAGSVNHLDITAMDAETVRTAGDPFEVALQLVDSDGNTVSGTVATVVLTETCTGGVFQWIETFVDDAVVTVTPTKACDINAIQGFGVVEGISVEGQSDPFSVRAGPLQGLEVQVSPSSVSAGDEGLHLWIEGQDIWGNPVEDEIIGVELTHDSNPVNEVTGTGQYTCSPAGPGKASCSAGLFRTGDSVVLEARSNGDIRGWGNPVRVTPGAVSEMSVSMATETVSAGEPLEVLIAALDLFGNQQSLSDEDLASLIFTDAHGELECTHDTTADMGPIYRYFCSFYIAGSDNHLSVIATTLAASGTDAPLLVRAGPVHHLDISLSDDVVSYGIVAGNSHVIELVATDEYGNSAEGTETVALSDVGGSLYPATTILEDGTGTETVASTRSIDGNSIWAKVDGVLVGGTGVFDVFHGAAEGLAVELSAAWTFTDTPVVATIDVIDGFGNTVYGDSYDVTIDQGWGDLTNISIDGTESIDLGFPEPGPQVPVVVQSGDWDATSGPLLVGEPCEYPSTFPMEIRGVEDGRICLSASGRAHGELIHRSSTASHWSVQMDDIIVGFGSPSPVGLEWSEPGRSHIRAFVLDEDDCGQEGMVDVYVGEEGQVTGPIAISGSTDTLTAGDPGDEGMADLWAQGYTCSGDLASGASLILQPMLGTTSASEDPGLDEDSLRSTIVLDGHGEAHFGWSMADEDQGGAGEILVGNAAGSAFGMHTLNVVGDAVSPYVWTTSPVGSSDELIDSITIQFSEVMLDPGSPEARAALVELLDPDGMGVVLGGAEWMADRSTLVVGLSAPIDTSAGAWSLTISEDFRDAAGNRLDGDWDGMSGGVWSSQFGSVGTFDSAMTGCSLSTGWFRPDGFDGSGIEADSVQLSGATTAPATWWKLDVFSEGGEHWHRDETLRTGLTSGLMSWDGRDHGGKVVPNGRYLMELVPMDPYRNEGIACIASVVVTNALEP